MLIKNKLLSISLPVVLLASTATANSSSTGIVNGEDSNVNIQNSARAKANGGTVNMHVETNVNGVKTELNSDQPGKISITNKNGQVTTEINSSTSASVGKSKPSPQPTNVNSDFRNENKNIENKLLQIRNQIQQFLNNLFQKIFG